MRAERIAHLYADPGPFAALLLDVSRETESGAHEVDIRCRNAADQLIAAGAPDHLVAAMVERVGASVGVPAPASQIVVGTERGVLLDDIVHAQTAQTTAVWADLPDLGTWIAHEDGAPPFVLALVDHEGGNVITYGADHIKAHEDTSVRETDTHEHKVRGGGLSHRRFQQTAENVWAHNADAVVDVVSSRISAGLRLVVVAGDPTSRSHVRSALAEHPHVGVVELEHGGRARDGGDDALHDAIRKVLAEHVMSERLSAAHELRERLGRGDGAVTGISDIAEAFVRGQVETLMLDPSAAAEEVISPREHPGFELTSDGPDGDVRADMALIAAAARTNADTVVLPPKAVLDTPAAALLRWSN